MRVSYFEKGRLRRPIFCFYGDTKDLFMDSVPCPLDCAEAVHCDLKAQGYRRIVLYRYQRGAYFLDHASMDLWHGDKKDAAPQMDNGMSLPGLPRLKGSLLRRQRLSSHPLSFPGISPSDMLRTARQFMQDSIETAVIFPDGANVLEEFFNIDRGLSLNDFFASVAERPALSNRNVVIFLLDRTPAQLEDLLNRPDWAGVRRSFDLRATLHHITAPGKEEIRDALHYLRLWGESGKRLQVQIDQIDAISGLIAAKLAKNVANVVVPSYATDEFTETDLQGTIQYFHTHFSERGVRLDLEVCRTRCRKSSDPPAMEELNQLIGMDSAKKKIREYIAMSKRWARPAKAQCSRLSMRKPPAKGTDITLHFLFVGKPGTGKTTIARLIGELLCENGFLPSGHLIETNVSDLKGRYVGWSEERTREALENAMGGVLFIDEAYELANGDEFSKAILTQLVKAMEDHRGAFSLIMAGYGENMEAVLSGSHGNPGLRSRFGNNIIQMEDYNSQELTEIFRHMAKKRRLSVSEELEALLPAFFENWRYAVAPKEWANARVVRNLLEGMLPLCGDAVVLTSGMIPEKWQRYTTHEEEDASVAEFSAMVGLESVRKEIQRLKYLIRDGADVRPHFLFYGNPGTGKTTVAKMLGQILKEAGVLKSGRVVSVKARNLIASHVGETGEKAEAVFKSAMGGVLLIDEAYHLTPHRDEPHDFGGAVLDLLLEYTDPNEKKSICIICAGYEGRMRELLKANDGLESRFSHPIRFPNYSAEELLQILKLELTKTKYQADEGFYRAALKNFQVNIAEIGRAYNGRYIGTYLERARAEYLVRTAGQAVKEFVLTAADAPDYTPGKT